MRFVDIGLSFPYLVLVMAIGAAVGDTTIVTLLLVLGFTSWFGTARLIRSKTIQVRSLDFILAARALGQITPRVLRQTRLAERGRAADRDRFGVDRQHDHRRERAQLPAGRSAATQALLGPHAVRGADATTRSRPRLAVFPGVMILLAVLGFNLVGEGLRDALDPQED